MDGRRRLLAVLLRPVEGGELVPGGAGPWRPVRVRGFMASRHRPLHSHRAETSSDAWRNDGEGGYPIPMALVVDVHEAAAFGLQHVDPVKAVIGGNWVDPSSGAKESGGMGMVFLSLSGFTRLGRSERRGSTTYNKVSVVKDWSRR